MTNEEKIAQLEGDLAAVKADLANVIVPGIAGLNTSVQTLKTELAGATLSPAAQTALDQAVADGDALKTQADNVAAAFTPPAPPAPTPTT